MRLFLDLLIKKKKLRKASKSLGERGILVCSPSNLSQSDCVYYVCRNSKASCYCEAVTFDNWIMTKRSVSVRREQLSPSVGVESAAAWHSFHCRSEQTSTISLFFPNINPHKDSPKVSRCSLRKHDALGTNATLHWQETLLFPPLSPLSVFPSLFGKKNISRFPIV